MNISLKHWTGTLIVAVVAGFVIFGLLRGQSALNNFLNRQFLKEDNQLSIISEKLSTPLPAITKTPTPILKPTLTPTPGTPKSISPSPILTPSRTPTPSPSLTPVFTKSPAAFPTPVPTPTPTSTPSSTPAPTSTFTPTPTLTPTPTPSSTPIPTPTPTPTPAPQLAIVINEIAWMGTAADPTDEWIELYNPNSFAVDITGWTIKSFKIKNGVLTADTPDITFQEKTIAAFGYFLLERTSNNTVSDIAADLIYSGTLNNPPDSEVLELRDNTGQLRDKVGHLTESGQVITWYAGHNASKSTMERIDSGKSGTGLSNWQTNNGQTRNGIDSQGNPINGTPKAKNSPAPY